MEQALHRKRRLCACLECIECCQAHGNPNIIFVENPDYGAFRKLPCVVPFIQSGQSRML
jgi:hypothetical protein